MGRFFSILIATFLSVLCALATWHYAEHYLAELEVKEVAAVVDAKKEESQKVAKEIVDRIKYEWKLEERTNPVTGERVATATRFSEDIGSAITFRCYGLEKKRFDVLVSFPEGIDWHSSEAEMKFRIDKGELTTIKTGRTSSSTAVPQIEEVNVEKESLGLSFLKKRYQKQNSAVLEFKRIGGANIFEASIPDGTIYQQVISIDLEGVQDALKPVLSLCGKETI